MKKLIFLGLIIFAMVLFSNIVIAQTVGLGSYYLGMTRKEYNSILEKENGNYCKSFLGKYEIVAKAKGMEADDFNTKSIEERREELKALRPDLPINEEALVNAKSWKEYWSFQECIELIKPTCNFGMVESIVWDDADKLAEIKVYVYSALINEWLVRRRNW